MKKIIKHPCTIDGIDYESERTAMRILGIGIRQIRNRLQSPDYPGYVSKRRVKRRDDKKGGDKADAPCSVDGVEYESVKAAAKDLGISTSGLKYRLRSRSFPNYISEHHPKRPKSKTKACTINGIEYESIRAAAKDVGMSPQALRNRLLSSSFPNYISKHHRKRLPKSHLIKSRKPKTETCTINGIEYESIKAAARDLRMRPTMLKNRLLSPNFPGYLSEYYPKIWFTGRNVGESAASRKGPAFCLIAGIEYKSMASVVKDFGISAYEVKRRLVSTEYPDYLCGKYPKKSPFKYEVGSKKYKTMPEIAEDKGISEEAVSYRINSDLHPEYRRLPKER